MRFLLVLPLIAASILGQDTFQGVERIVAVGDVHGDYDQLVRVLRGAGVIDNKNKWKGGKTHLVQTGDVPDRGPGTRKALDLLMDLEKQAKKAGGMVHPLIGNHEAMNLYGDLRYVTAEEYATFKTSDSQQLLDNYFEQVEYPELQKKSPSADASDLKKAWMKDHPPGWVEQRYAFGPKGKYGQWIRKNEAVIKVNGMIFMHGGWSPKYASKTIADLNTQVHFELADFQRLAGGIVMDPEGPLWYRGLARDPESLLKDFLDRLLAAQQATAIVIGHTPTAGAILTRFDGRVIMIDVGMSKAYGGPDACLVVEGGKRMALHRGKLLDLPSDKSQMLAYLKAAAALDPQPSPLQKLIDSGAAAEMVKDDK
ncbi:MAG: metallophosphoesterase [Bryobacterales bacterium]|nr:metallophosphoesterase [Bryobacterales bacterium]